MEHPVVVAIYPNEMEAELAHATLAAANLESYVQFDKLPLLKETEGVRLLVDAGDLEEAKTLLTTDATEQEP
jgi:hypothetical protein